jgi:hypothetical protein
VVPFGEGRATGRGLPRGQADRARFFAAVGRKPLPARSPKRASDEARYLKARKAWLEGKCCARCGTTENLTVQHMRGRVGPLLLDQRFWLPLCWDPCHSWATEHPREAIAQGWSMPRTWDSECPTPTPGDAA